MAPHSPDLRAVTVVARDLHKSYNSLEAVRGISFEVHAGECFGFLGPNGAGKTSTMRMIGCVSPVTAGQLEVLGLDVARASRAIKRRLGVVPQEDNLDEYLSVRENLDLYAHYFDLGRDVIRERITELLEFVQLTDKADTEVKHLSGGMRHRLLIARALISEPDALILDEPTTGLDPQARHLMWEKLRVLKAQRHTLLLTTHYMDEAEQLCDRLVVMHGGKIIAEGPPRQLIREHVSPEVIEIYGDPEQLHSLQSRFGSAAARCERLHDRLLLFTDDATALMARIGAAAGSLERHSRRTTLEDVFLKLTGHGLLED